MQKLDFSRNIFAIKKQLLSELIVQKAKESTAKDTGTYDGREFTSYLLESKSNYDRIIQNEDFKKIIEYLDGASLYESKSVSEIINNLNSRGSNFGIFYKNIMMDFISFHSSILKISNLANKLFLEESNIPFDDKLDEGIIILQIVEIDSSLLIETYNKILKTLNELISSINKALNIDESPEAQIIFFDSGSSTNFGIKTGVETAKSLFLVFKEIWDWFINKKYYKNKLMNEAVLENLEVLKVINSSKEQGILTDDEAKVLVHTIKTRTSDLIELNVLPKKMIDKDIVVSHQDLLKEYKEVKQLNSGKQDTA